MQIHQTDPGTLLYVDGHSLKAKHGNGNPSLIAGAEYISGYREGIGPWARFEFITSFVQLDRDKIVAVDRHNSCLRLISLNQTRTWQYSGICKDGGGFLTKRYGEPNGIIKDNQRLDILLVTDEAQHAILELHTESKKITTFYQNNVMSAFWPKMITQHSLTGDLYLTVQSMIYRINYTSRRLRYIAGSSALGFADGSFPKARFNHPTGILLVDEGKTILVADQPNGSVRKLYTDDQTTRTICRKKYGRAFGGPAVCGLDNPYSLLVNGTDLLIGEHQRISKIQGRSI